MDIKFLIIVIISIIGFIVLMSEISSLKREVAKKTQDNEELVRLVSTEVKRESNVICGKFRNYTNDMIQQFRTMSVLERQPVIKMSDHDQFVESEERNDCNYDNGGENCQQVKIPYLSEVNVEKQFVVHEEPKIAENEKSQSSADQTSIISEKNNEPKLHHLELIKQSLDSDKHNDVASEKITFGQKSLGKITSYTKTDLVSLAKQYGAETTATKDGKTRDLTKRDIYNNIMKRMNTEM